MGVLERFLYEFVRILFLLIPALPQPPETFRLSVLNYVDTIITYGGNLLGVFVRISTLQLILSLYLLIVTADVIYKVVTWLLHKLPINVD